MASVHILILVIGSLAVLSSAEFVTVKCHSSSGYAGLPSKLNCVLKTEQSPEIMQVFWKYEDSVVLKVEGGTETGEGRFRLADANWKKSKDISLLVDDTKISDQGKYGCTVVTNMGITTGDATLEVKAKYSQPVTTYKLDKDEVKVDLTCTAKGGYPQGAIHWFDRYDTNWTRSAETTVTKMEDKTFMLQSTYTSAEASHEPYRCVVFNSEWKEEGNKSVDLDITRLGKRDQASVETKHIAAAVVVIGSLICGLLVALLIFKKRSQRALRRPSTQPMLRHEHQGYCDYPPDPEAGKELTAKVDKDDELTSP